MELRQTNMIQRFFIYNTVFDGDGKHVEVYVKPLQQADRESVYYHNPNVSAVNRLY